MTDCVRIDRRTMLATGALAATSVFVPELSAAEAVAPPSRRQPRRGQIPVAYLIDHGTTLIDFIGPLEAFADANQAKVPGFFGFTVGAEYQPYDTQHGVKLVPEYTLADAPMPKILIIPAQGGDSEVKVAWIRKVHDQADVVMSVCTGAFLLAETGLLDGLKATTHHAFYDKFAEFYPKVEVVREQRFVDNGKLVTAGGLTSGVDAALHLITRYHGDAAAQIVADYMEHRRGPWRGHA